MEDSGLGPLQAGPSADMMGAFAEDIGLGDTELPVDTHTRVGKKCSVQLARFSLDYIGPERDF